MSDGTIIPVVSIAFRKVVYSGKFDQPFKKIGEPILQIEVLGDRHNLECVGELLFEHHLREVLDEELDEHLWRFEPSDHVEYPCLALDPSLPILSPEMHTVSPFGGFVDEYDPPSTPCRIKEGIDLRFKYDEGTPTHLMATIESITPLPENKSVDNYPTKKADPFEHLVGEKRKRIEDTPILTIPMDEAYPSLRDRLFEHGVRLEIGRGSDPISIKLEDTCWARIWGGDASRCAMDRSLECPLAFEHMDEALLCFDRAIERQVSPTFPAMTRTIEYRNRTTGEVYLQDSERDLDLSVTANVMPTSAPQSAYPPETERDLQNPRTDYLRADQDIPLRSWSRYCFNFTLPADWQQDVLTPPPEFSFEAQFPRVSAWLTHPCNTCRWLSVERGVVCAVKGRHNPRAADKVLAQTLKHTTLHAMFTDLEESLGNVLPKSWKIK